MTMTSTFTLAIATGHRETPYGPEARGNARETCCSRERWDAQRCWPPETEQSPCGRARGSNGAVSSLIDAFDPPPLNRVSFLLHSPGETSQIAGHLRNLQAFWHPPTVPRARLGNYRHQRR